MGEDRSTKTALRQTAEQFHILVDSVEEYAIYMLDPTGNVMTWNAGAEKIKQYAAQEIIGKTSPAFIPRKKLLRKNRNAIYARQRVEVIFEIKAHAFGKTDPSFRRKLSSLYCVIVPVTFVAFPKSPGHYRPNS